MTALILFCHYGIGEALKSMVWLFWERELNGLNANAQCSMLHYFMDVKVVFIVILINLEN